MNIMLLLRAESIQKIGNKPYQIPYSHDSLVEPCESVLIHYYGLLACSLRHYAIYPRFQTFCRGTLLSTLSTIYGFPSSPRCNLFSPQNLCKFCFNFSRVECWLQEKLKTKLLQKFVEKKKLYYGEIESRTDRFTA